MYSQFSKIVLVMAMMKILSAPVLAQTLNTTSSISLHGVAYGGSGCPQGSLAFFYAPSDTRYGPIKRSRLLNADPRLQRSGGIPWIYFFHWEKHLCRRGPEKLPAEFGHWVPERDAVQPLEHQLQRVRESGRRRTRSPQDNILLQRE